MNKLRDSVLVFGCTAVLGATTVLLARVPSSLPQASRSWSVAHTGIYAVPSAPFAAVGGR